MKKSYDYFKTLKDLSLIVSDSFESLNDLKTVNKNYLCFSAMRNELSENLIDEFVAPIERNDIYILSFRLWDEFNYVIKLCEFFSLTKTDFSDSIKQIGKLLFRQNHVFDFKNLLKSSEKGYNIVSSELLDCKKVKKSIVNGICDSICCHNQPLICYAIGSSCVEVVSSIEATYNEICRVLINNS